MKRWLTVMLFLLAWDLSMGASCGGIKPPQPPATCPEACPAGTHCEGTVCVADPPPPVECLPGVPWCTAGQTCGNCKHNPTSDPTHCEMAPACPPPVPVCPTCPVGQSCTDPAVGCVSKPPEPPEPTACTIPLTGTPVLGAYWLQDRIVDFTPKLTSAARCALPEVGYPGRQTCPVCDEACVQRGICEQQLIGGSRINFNCDSETLRCYDDDGWKVRVAGVGTGTMLACYPNRRACVTLQMACDAGGCRP